MDLLPRFAEQPARSADEVIASLKAVAARNFGDRKPSLGHFDLAQISTRVNFVDEFSNVLVLCFGANSSLIEKFCGLIQNILLNTFMVDGIVKSFVTMLERMSPILPRPPVYEQTRPLRPELEKKLIVFYCEIMCFFARVARYLNTVNFPNWHYRWPRLEHDFEYTLKRVKEISSLVQKHINSGKITFLIEQLACQKEILELLRAIKWNQSHVARFDNIPLVANINFSGREHTLATVHATLKPGSGTASSKSVALFGLGGVGKTHIALQYAHQNRCHFEVVLWVAAEDSATVIQSFFDIAIELGLVKEDDREEVGADAIRQIKSWLQVTSLSYPVFLFTN